MARPVEIGYQPGLLRLPLQQFPRCLTRGRVVDRCEMREPDRVVGCFLEGCSPRQYVHGRNPASPSHGEGKPPAPIGSNLSQVDMRGWRFGARALLRSGECGAVRRLGPRAFQDMRRGEFAFECVWRTECAVCMDMRPLVDSFLELCVADLQPRQVSWSFQIHFQHRRCHINQPGGLALNKRGYRRDQVFFLRRVRGTPAPRSGVAGTPRPSSNQVYDHATSPSGAPAEIRTS